MKQSHSKAMAEATRLTRTGDLAGATALIQSLLAGAPPVPPADTADDLVEGTFTRLDTPPPAPARQPLSETLRWIASGGMPATPTGRATSSPVAQGARFTAHSHRGPDGHRDYMLYRPASAAQDPSALPLIVMLHGCTQSPEDFAAGTGMNALAEEQGVMIAYPAQPQAANMQRCWNWYNPGDQGRDRGEPAIIAGLTRDILQAEAVDPSRVYIAGLSAGGAAATLVARAYPDVFAAAGVHSGLPAGAASDVASAFGAMRNGAAGASDATAMPTIVFHGDADGTVHPANGTAVARQSLAGFPALTAKVKTGKAKGGRAFRRTSHAGPDGRTMMEHWSVDGAGHAWSGGHPSGSYTDPTGPDASREFLRFFLQHSTRGLA
jgi:poly(hydroxyalkanoate) depolymerase family esterase